MANVRNFATVYSSEYQMVFIEQAVAMEVADVSLKSVGKGNSFKKSYPEVSDSDVYSRSSDMVPTDVNDTEEYLTVDKEYYISRYIDKHDNLQDLKDTAAKYAEIDAQSMARDIDADILGEAFNAGNTIDDGDFSGTAGNSVAITASNVTTLFGLANEKMDLQNVPRGNRVAVVSPRLRRILTDYGIGKDTQMGDEFFTRGGVGMVDGFRVLFSNLLPTSYVLGLATNPTANDTVTIAGQVFTFVSSIGTTAGNVLIGGDADATRLNLATLINAPATTTANGVALTGAKLKTFRKRISAVNDATANTLTVKYKGGGASTVASSLTATTDVWNANKSTSHCVFMHDKAISAVVQEAPDLDVNKAPLRKGNFQNTTSLYGVKTFNDGTKMLVNAKIKL